MMMGDDATTSSSSSRWSSIPFFAIQRDNSQSPTGHNNENTTIRFEM